jgi:hypothetical protein
MVIWLFDWVSSCTAIVAAAPPEPDLLPQPPSFRTSKFERKLCKIWQRLHIVIWALLDLVLSVFRYGRLWQVFRWLARPALCWAGERCTTFVGDLRGRSGICVSRADIAINIRIMNPKFPRRVWSIRKSYWCLRKYRGWRCAHMGKGNGISVNFSHTYEFDPGYIEASITSQCSITPFQRSNLNGALVSICENWFLAYCSRGVRSNCLQAPPIGSIWKASFR